ncbi:response regulator [Pedobacter chinensis]|uniref:Response regulator n=1 Tax=Pedobacter chinensis TaxID=2282421 RepID=A0A369Q428_9SPHI|nr:response regulator [Pedobacter chinensis]RDC58027.1 response regulator [Pedobacter chinensis]
MKKILIIEDNLSNAEMIAAIFDEEGFETRTLLKVEDLSNILAKFKPDLILMDILLEGEDGRILCNKIKSDIQTSHIIVILMTAALLHTIPEIPCNPDAIVTKPFDIYNLSKQVSELLN